MIDKKNELLEEFERYPQYWMCTHPYGNAASSEDTKKIKELIRLARLGLQMEKTPLKEMREIVDWAQNVALPALDAFETTSTIKKWCDMDGGGVSTKWFHGVVSGDVAKKALAQYPAQTKEKL